MRSHFYSKRIYKRIYTSFWLCCLMKLVFALRNPFSTSKLIFLYVSQSQIKKYKLKPARLYITFSKTNLLCNMMEIRHLKKEKLFNYLKIRIPKNPCQHYSFYFNKIQRNIFYFVLFVKINNRSK